MSPADVGGIKTNAVFDQFESRTPHEMVERSLGDIIGKRPFENHRAVAGGAHHHASLSSGRDHFPGNFLDDLKIG